MKLFIAMAIVVSGAAHACQGEIVPAPDQLPGYNAVFLGEVTGVVRTEFEEDVRRSADCPETGRVNIECSLPVGSWAERHDVHVKVDRIFRGAPGPIQVVVVDGCGRNLPEMGEKGLFFVVDESWTAIPVYEREGPDFGEWMSRLAAGR